MATAAEWRRTATRYACPGQVRDLSAGKLRAIQKFRQSFLQRTHFGLYEIRPLLFLKNCQSSFLFINLLLYFGGAEPPLFPSKNGLSPLFVLPAGSYSTAVQTRETGGFVFSFINATMQTTPCQQCSLTAEGKNNLQCCNLLTAGATSTSSCRSSS